MSILTLVLVCLIVGLGIRVLRRLPRLVFLATLVGTAGMLALLVAAPAESFDFVGRALTGDAGTRAFLFVAIGTTAALALFAPLTFLRAGDMPASVISNSLGAFLFWSLAPLIIAIALDSFPLAALFWALGLLPLIFLAQPRHENRAGGALQFLLLTVFSASFLLLANRLIELYPLTPENLDLLRGAIVFLILGLGIALAMVPLNIWLGSFADEMPLLGMAFLVGVAQPVGVWLLIGLLSRAPWLAEKSPVLTVLYVGGALSAFGGALFAIAERRDNRFLAALALLPLGDALLGLGLGTRAGLMGACALVLNRALGIALTSGGLSFARYHPERRWQVIGIVGVFGGGFLLLGLPPGLGASARAVAFAGMENLNLLLALEIARVAALLGLLRFTLPLIATTQIGVETSAEFKVVPYLSTLLLVLLIASAVTIGIFPQILGEALDAILQRAEFVK